MQLSDKKTIPSQNLLFVFVRKGDFFVISHNLQGSFAAVLMKEKERYDFFEIFFVFTIDKMHKIVYNKRVKEFFAVRGEI